MVGSGVVLMGLCTWAFVRRKTLASGQHGRLLRALRWGLPLPWIAILSGWAVAEIGRQPWTVQGHLPTFQAMQAPPLAQAAGMAALLFAGAVLVATAYALAWLAIFKTGPDRRLRTRGLAGWSGKTSVMGA
jgi:cytochrome d ubiquinol oxidase subunit I